MELLRLSRAARRLGVHPVTLRSWADSGKIPMTWVGRERRFSSGDIDAVKVPGGVRVERPKAQGGREELLEDFVSLVTTFAGRLYGMRSAAARRRLLAESDRHSPGGTR
jgi:excisionase family DNA binding protein